LATSEEIGVRAAVYHGRRDVRIEGVEPPGTPGPRDLLIDVAVAGICGTDATEWAHGPLFTPLNRRHPVTGHVGPMVIGHEFVGAVAEAGSEVRDFATGDFVASGAGVWCGSCRWCKEGRTNLCERYYTHGLNAPGGLAEQVVVPAKTCRKIPPELDHVSAALAQPVAVAVHAFKRSGATPGDQVVVMGIGGIGSLILAAARVFGVSDIVAVDVDSDRLQTASRLGAMRTIDARVTDVNAAVRDLTGGAGADVVIEAAGAAETPQQALHAVRRGGRVLIVGLQAAPRPVDLHSLAVREIDVRSTNAHVCDRDLPDALRVLSSTSLAEVVVVKVIPLPDLVKKGLEPLATGKASGKTLVDLHLG
jgi:(R,R)-butanediol dehydrogenase/meso-butanediol dehydrogenase/diacetyl reductase